MFAHQETVLAEVTQIFRTVFEDPTIELTLATTSDDVPCWDSMNHITLVVEAECRFDIQFQTAEIEELKSVGELVRLIQAKLALVSV
jgi:acyl carrier protein